jgi:cleavage and polyadenylation specificity factor subunit 4
MFEGVFLISPYMTSYTGNNNKMKTGLDGSDTGNIAKEKKRSYALMYTPREVQQWREARRKNYPTKFLVEKKVKKNVSASILDEEAKMRRQVPFILV